MSQPFFTAILVDGAFFLKRYQSIFRNGKSHTPEKVAKYLHEMSYKHVDTNNGYKLYRILYYDCLPLTKKAHNPITKKSINFETIPDAVFRFSFFEELKKKRSVALRLGSLKSSGNWLIKPDQTKSLLSGKINISDITDRHVFYEMRQKGVDIKIGLDIASMAFKRSVKQIVLVSGDSDFVPAAKLARREGIDFILDPMWNNVDPGLYEHIDGLVSKCPRPFNKCGPKVTSK